MKKFLISLAIVVFLIALIIVGVSCFNEQLPDDRDAVMGANYIPLAGDEDRIAVAKITETQLQGIDVSHWQKIINWQMAKETEVDFAFIRAGSVNASWGLYTDRQFERNAVESRQNGVYRDFYWFFRPNYNAEKQADYFYSLISDKDGDMYPVVDVEVHGGLNQTEVAKAVFNFQTRLIQLLRKPVMIYTSPGFWNKNVETQSWMRELPLWVAHWDQAVPILPSAWSGETYTFWQTHVGEDGCEYGMGSKLLDHNVYISDLHDFLIEFPEEPIPTPTPTLEPTPIATSISDCSNIKSITFVFGNGRFRELFN